MKKFVYLFCFFSLCVEARECNSLDLDESKSINGRYKYCFKSENNLNKLVNLSSDDISIFFFDGTSSVIYPYEFINVPKEFSFQVQNKVQKFINKFEENIFVFRDPKPKRVKRGAPASILLRLGASGATVGAIGAVATSPNKSPTAKQLTSGVVGGFVGGVATPALGNVAGPSLGVAAAGACMEACHL
ncbi:hypothetical protein UB33_10460 [Photobacterium angustum]|uniref:hypothetical protein n=1 Tax=Photobacterium angustum TaxID=661 RepID=UPI0005DC716C|nr:hypothetical protein [Photobacterium angustum]KJG06080.1 hypothetical protein UB33_10460 [Photobacterium angustum]PSV88544.1 hypothetical protein CTN01_20030 [Photobacterium angustum]